MRTTRLVFPLLLLLSACAHRPPAAPLPFPTQPLPAEAAALRRPEDTDYRARVRLELTRRQSELRECLEEMPGRETLQSPTLTRALYISPGIAYFPQRSAAPPMRAFEQCMLGLLRNWHLPRPVNDYEGAWVLLRFEPGGAAPAPTATASPLFELEGVHGLLEVMGKNPFTFLGTASNDAGSAPKPDAESPPDYDAGEGMTRPVEISGPKINYSQQALIHRVQGVMIVRCVITTAGNLEACRIVKPLPFMEMQVLSALLQKRYRPVTFRGQPFAVDYTFTIQLKLPQG